MCLSPIRLRTSSLYRSVHYSKYFVEVPCGQCAECQVQKKNDWYLRNYFESTVSWSNGGYALFDTLTYDDKHLPSISKHLLGCDINNFDSLTSELDVISDFCDINDIDFNPRKIISMFRENNFSCFDYRDVQLFLKDLRITLSRLGYPVEHSLRFFLASEYGHDELYIDSKGRERRGTCRPHYHIIFYVNGYLKKQGLTPEILSLFVGTLWKNGRTDGIPYRDSTYVVNHNTFGPDYITDPLRLRGVQYYVSKYVCKDYDFKDSIDKRISFLLTQLYRIQYDSPDYKEKKRKLSLFMDQFHRQSLGFGLTGFCSLENLSFVQTEGKVKIPDSKDGVKLYSIPQYYIRKLFQKCVKDAEGRPHWVWNDLGKDWQIRRIKSNIEVLSQKMQDWFNNMSTYTDLHVSFRPKVEKLLRNRSWKDYAEYLLVYKGRFCLDPHNLDSPDNIISSSLEDPFSLEEGQYFKRDADNRNLYYYKGYEYTSKMLESSHVLNDTCLGDKFTGFDTITDIYRISMDSYNIKKQIKYEEDLAASKRLKSYGLKTKK